MTQYMPPPPYYKKYTNAAVACSSAPKPPHIPEDTYTTFGIEREIKGLTTLPWKQNLLIEKEPKYRQLYGDTSVFTEREKISNTGDNEHTTDKDKNEEIDGEDDKGTEGLINSAETSIGKSSTLVVNGKDPTNVERGKKRKFDHRVELKKLNKSIVLNYMQLLEVLTTDPSQYMKVFNQLVGLFHNMHALINDCRPHQARETLRAMMEAQVEQKENCVLDLETYFDAVTSALREVLDQVQTSDISDLVSPGKRARLGVESKVAHLSNGTSQSLESNAKTEVAGDSKVMETDDCRKPSNDAKKAAVGDVTATDIASTSLSMDTDRPPETGTKADGGMRKKVDAAAVIARLAKAVDLISEADLDDYLTPKRLS